MTLGQPLIPRVKVEVSCESALQQPASLALKSFSRLLPILVTRLALSLKKAADPELDLEWRVDHFTARTEQPSTPPSFELQSMTRPSTASSGGLEE